jgi:hypothetical protein
MRQVVVGHLSDFLRRNRTRVSDSTYRSLGEYSTWFDATRLFDAEAADFAVRLEVS